MYLTFKLKQNNKMKEVKYKYKVLRNKGIFKKDDILLSDNVDIWLENNPSIKMSMDAFNLLNVLVEEILPEQDLKLEYDNVAELVYTLRKYLKLTQAEVANKSGFVRTTIVNLENETQNFNLNNLKHLVDRLDYKLILKIEKK